MFKKAALFLKDGFPNYRVNFESISISIWSAGVGGMHSERQLKDDKMIFSIITMVVTFNIINNMNISNKIHTYISWASKRRSWARVPQIPQDQCFQVTTRLWSGSSQVHLLLIDLGHWSQWPLCGKWFWINVQLMNHVKFEHLLINTPLVHFVWKMILNQWSPLHVPRWHLRDFGSCKLCRKDFSMDSWLKMHIISKYQTNSQAPNQFTIPLSLHLLRCLLSENSVPASCVTTHVEQSG